MIRDAAAAAPAGKGRSSAAALTHGSITSLHPAGELTTRLPRLFFIHSDIINTLFTALLILFLLIPHFLLDVTHHIVLILLRLSWDKQQKLQELWISYLHISHDVPKRTFWPGQERTGAACRCCAVVLDLGSGCWCGNATLSGAAGLTSLLVLSPPPQDGAGSLLMLGGTELTHEFGTRPSVFLPGGLN